MTILLPSLRGVLSVPPWARDALWRRAQAVPSLDLRFADNKSLVDAVSGQSLITFTRASGGSFIGSDRVLRTAAVDEPRFSHDPLTGESLGLLVEESRANLILNSATFQPSSLGNPASYTVNQVAPDGTTTASSQTANNPRTFIDYTGIANAQYTFSVYAKAVSGTLAITCQLKNAMSDTVIATSAGVTLTTDWQRISITGTTNGATAGVRIEIGGPVVGAPSGTVFWGAQLEAGAFPTSYIPTTTAAATRSADVATLISQAIANGIRTLYVEFRSPASGTRGVASLNDNTADKRASIITSGTDPRLVVVDGGVEQANIDAGTVAANAISRMAVRIDTNSFAASFNGGTAQTDTSGTLPTVDRLMLGRTQAGEYLNGPIARVVGWTAALSDATLERLSR